MVSPYRNRKESPRKGIIRAAIVLGILAVLITSFYASYLVFFAKGPEVAASTGYVFGDANNITVVISRDFGETNLKQVTVNYSNGMTALKALQAAAEVEEQGGFVWAIDGLRSEYSGEGSGDPVDWFYYVNGIFATVYAIFYEMQPGDILRWDYHWWALDRTSGCIATDLFAGFAYGYRGVENGGIWPNYIVDCGGFTAEAQQLKEAFDGWGLNATVRLWSDLSEDEKKKANLFLVGTFDSNLTSYVNDNYEGMGLFYHYDGEEVYLFDPVSDSPTQTFEHCGIIASAKDPWNPLGVWNAMNLCWMATGVTRSDVQAALDTLINDPHVLSDKFGGFAIANGEFYEVF